ncbi:MAG TPA: LysM peptidoglycan-binding domain-containing protein, partial [Methylomirabilota bacterium]
MLAHGGVAIALLALIVFIGFFPRTVRSATPPPLLRASLISMPGLSGAAAAVPVTTLEAAPVPLTVVAPPVASADVIAAEDGTPTLLATLAAARETSEDDDLEPGRASEQLPLFYRYEVEPGDTVSTIAARFGIASDYILWNNIDIISDEDLLAVGQQIQVPSVEGIIHNVRVDETLTEIADLYDADVADILAFAANGLANADLLKEGTTILVPGGHVVPPPAPAIRPAAVASQESTTPPVVTGAPSAFGFVGPVVGLITSDFGPSHPLGIDINAQYVPIVAAASGQVVFAGG